MLPLIWHYLKAFLLDEYTAKRVLVGVGGLLAATLTTVLAFGTDTVLAWTPHELVRHGAVALVAAIAAALPGAPIAKPEPKQDPAP